MNQTLKFWKVHSVGNDFPLIHLDDINEKELPKISEFLAKRHFSIGGDGILAVKRLSHDLLKLRMFNPDGTEDFCGNGLRCAAMYAKKMGWVGSEFKIQHLGENVGAKIDGDWVITHTDPASYVPQRIPAKFESGDGYHRVIFSSSEFGELKGSALTTGSTHVVMDWGIPDSPLFEKVSSIIETDSQFPERTSIIWRENLSDNSIRIRIWERGAGETLGCGTGSTAAAVEVFRERGHGGTVEVQNPGGSIFISAEAWDRPLRLRGTAHAVFSGEIEVPSNFLADEASNANKDCVIQVPACTAL